MSRPAAGPVRAQQAVEAGAKLLEPGQESFWGGYSGYFSGPDDFLWEVAWNPHLSSD
jgi:uncharacterized glyoxalase superfamily protein PhnB